MKCEKCGTELPDEVNFCFNCGSSMEEQLVKAKSVEAEEVDEFLDLNVEESVDENVIWEEVPDDDLVLDTKVEETTPTEVPKEEVEEVKDDVVVLPVEEAESLHFEPLDEIYLGENDTIITDVITEDVVSDGIIAEDVVVDDIVLEEPVV
ncbi:MAG: hypothetical protein BZ136_06095, partial [Methanosphaera sp. rholeuAM74]